MIWYLFHLIVTLLWDSLRFSHLSPDDKTLELLLLRQQLLIVRRHQKRGPTITRSEKLMLLTLVEQFRHFALLPNAQLEQLLLIFKPDTLLSLHLKILRLSIRRFERRRRTRMPNAGCVRCCLALRHFR